MSQKRHSGFTLLEKLSSGSHLCHFYADARELSDAIIPYLQKELLNDEKCIWICSNPIDEEAAVELLKSKVPGLSCLFSTKQMQIMNFDEFYLDPQGEFNIGSALSKWCREVELSMESGFAGLRVAKNMSWIRPTRTILDYEEQFSAFSTQTPMISLCSYPAKSVDMVEKAQISHIHDYLLAKRNSAWIAVPLGRYPPLTWNFKAHPPGHGVLTLDAQGTLMATNHVCLKLFGKSVGSYLGANIKGFADKFEIRTMTGRLDPTGNLPFTFGDMIDYWKAHSPVYGELDLIVSAKTHYSKAATPGLTLLTFYDITGLRLFETLEKGFLQILGHELKNPLQTIKALLNVMESHAADSKTPLSRYIKLANSCLKRITALVDDLVSAEQATHKSLVVNASRVNLVPLIKESLEPFLSTPSHVFVTKFDQKADLPVLVDPTRIHQILTNLISNAVKYTPEGKSIWLDLDLSAHYATVIIEDEGIGIPVEESSRVFEQFYRGTNTKDKFRGAGLGLYVSRGLARMHGGDLWAEPRPQGGTLMKLSLPILNETG